MESPGKHDGEEVVKGEVILEVSYLYFCVISDNNIGNNNSYSNCSTNCHCNG